MDRAHSTRRSRPATEPCATASPGAATQPSLRVRSGTKTSFHAYPLRCDQTWSEPGLDTHRQPWPPRARRRPTVLSQCQSPLANVQPRTAGTTRSANHIAYRKSLRELQIELVKLQKHLIGRGERLLVVLEGRDASGKDGTIKRIVKKLSPRETRVVALGPPTDRDRHSWYFQRYVPHLSAEQELVLFNRSWYNRAGVERVMGFCSAEEHQLFLETVPQFEHMLVRSGITLVKYYLDISKHEQKKRLASRRRSR